MSSFPIQNFPFTQQSSKVVIWMQYSFNATVGTVIVQFQAANGTILGTEYVNIPEEVYSSWTASDQVILDYIQAQLGFTII